MQVKDPVCGMTLDEKNARAKTTYEGTTYYFCSDNDKKAFEKDPEKYATAGSGSPGWNPS